MKLLLVIGLIATILGLVADGIRLAREQRVKNAEAKLRDPIVILETRLQKQRDHKQALKATQQTNNVANTNISSFLTHDPLEK